MQTVWHRHLFVRANTPKFETEYRLVPRTSDMRDPLLRFKSEPVACKHHVSLDDYQLQLHSMSLGEQHGTVL